MAQIPPTSYRPARQTDCMAECPDCQIEWAWGAPVDVIEELVEKHNAQAHGDGKT